MPNILFNFIGNVERLRSQIVEAKQMSHDVTEQQVSDYRRLEDTARSVERNLQSDIAKRTKLEQEVADIEAEISRQKGIQAQNSGIVNQQATAKLRTLRTQLSTEQQLLAIEEKKILAQNKQLVNLGDQQRVLTRQYQDFQRQSRFQQQQQGTQLSSAVRSRQAIASAGFSFIQGTNNPILQSLAAPLIGFGFGGPAGAGFAAAGLAVGKIVDGLTSTIGLLTKAVSMGFEFSQEMQTSQIAVAGILAQTSEIVDKQTGKLVPNAEKFSAAMSIAKEVQDRLLAVTLRTNITLEEGNTAVMAGLAQLTSRGVDPLRATDILVQLAAIAKAQGVGGEQIGRQINSVFGPRSSILKRTLQQTGLDLNSVFLKSGDDLADAFDSHLGQMQKSIAKTSDTLKTQLENVDDTMKFILGKAFDTIAPQLAGAIDKGLQTLFNGTGLTDQGLKLKDAFAKLFGELGKVFTEVVTPENVQSVVSGLTSIVELTGKMAHMTVGMLGFDSLNSMLKSVSSTLDGLNSGIDRARSGSLASGGNGNFAGFLLDKMGLLGGPDAQFGKKIHDMGAEAGLSQDKIDQILKAYSADLDKSIVITSAHRKRAQDSAMSQLGTLALDNQNATNPQASRFGVQSKDRIAMSAEQFKHASLSDVDSMIEKIKAAQEEGKELPVFLGTAISMTDALMKLEDKRNQIQRSMDIVAQKKLEIKQLRDETSEVYQQTQALREEFDVLAQSGESTPAQSSLSKVIKARGAQSLADSKLNDAEASAKRLSPEGRLSMEKEIAKLRFEQAKTMAGVVSAEIDAQRTLNQEMRTTAERIDTIGDAIERQKASVGQTETSMFGIGGQFLAQAGFSKQIATERSQNTRTGNQIKEELNKAEGEKSLKNLLGEDATEIDAYVSRLKAMQTANTEARISLDAMAQSLMRLLELRRVQAEQEATLALHQAQESSRKTHATLSGLSGSLPDVLGGIKASRQQARDIEAQVTTEKEELNITRQRRLELAYQASIQRDLGMDTTELDGTVDGLVTKEKQITAQIIQQQAEVAKLRNVWGDVQNVLNSVTSAVDNLLHGLKVLGQGQNVPGVNTQNAATIGGGLSDLRGLGDPSISKKDKAIGGLGDITAIIGSIGSSLQEGKQNGLGAANVGIDVASGVASMFGPVGQLVGGIMQGFKAIFGVFHSLFSAAAQKTATDIKNQVDSINQAFSAGTATLIQTIDSLEQQRQRAIELQSQKGGKDLGKQEQQQIDQELAQLKKQQKEILDNFDFELGLQRLGQGYTNFGNAVHDALKKVQDFIGAGGSLDQAKEFLSNTLEQLKQSMTNDVTTAQIQALDRAKTLIDLEKQRQQLIDQNEQKIRAILGQGLGERELTIAEQKSAALGAQQDTFQDQLDSINDQINSNRALLNIDKQLLDSGMDLNNLEALRAQSITLQVQQRQQEVAALLQEQNILQNIQEKNGTFFLSPDLYKKLLDSGTFSGITQNIYQLTIYMDGKTTKGPIDPGDAGDLQDILNRIRNKIGRGTGEVLA